MSTLDFPRQNSSTKSISSEKARTSHTKSMKSYATNVFRESSIGMVASIASTYSNNRKLFKSLVLAACLIGFLYQCITFLKVVFQYPTSVNVDIQRPKLFDVPAYTFCNNNGLKRSVYCRKYSDRCTEANETFCAEYHPYCGENKRLMPKKEFLNFEHIMTYEELLSIGDDLNDFLRDNKNDFNDAPVGPFIRSKDLEYGGMLCYSLHSVINTSKIPLKANKHPLFKKPANEFTFFVEEDEMFTPGSKPGVLFKIHSPYVAVNPFDDAIFLKPGRLYKIYVHMTEEHLLKEPYETDCINYQDQWEANNRTGPRIQEMCKHKCQLETSLKCFGCKMPLLLYPTSDRICTRDEWFGKDCPKEILDENEHCTAMCKEDCHTTKYSVSVQERYDVKYSVEGDVLENFDRYIFVQVYLEAGEVMTLKHSPKYMTVEVFSAIGGFIGCWLGISLMDIADISESFIRIAGYFFAKRHIPKQ